MKPIHRAVLFDLDGTLLDTLDDLGDSINRALVRLGFPTHGRESFRYFVGEGARMLVERALPEDQRDPATVERALQLYRDEYYRGWNIKTRAYDGVPELLDGLATRGIARGILSNKPHDMTLQCVQGYLARWPFGVVLGQREHVARKPDPQGALEAANILQVKPTEILYLGDTATDMETARAAGMFAVGATWGFRPTAELLEHGAQALAHHPREILEGAAPILCSQRPSP
jgi:phosphoglycolate phosphatase